MSHPRQRTGSGEPQASVSETATPSVFLAPPRNRYFTGRDAVLTQLAEGLPQGPMAVCGLGGMGKTQVLTEYAHRYRASYSAVLWVEATSSESLDSGWSHVAPAVGLQSEGSDSATVRSRVKQWLQEHPGWLLVFDNVEDLAVVRSWVSGLKNHGDILLSTRAATIRRLAEPLTLEILPEADGVAFLLSRAGLATDESAVALVDLLGGLPLALEQAAAYVENLTTDFAAYIALYQTHGLQLLAKRGELNHDADHPESVTVTWLLSFEKVRMQNKATIDLLTYCAFLHSEGIPERILTDLVSSVFFQVKQLSFWAKSWYYTKRFVARAKQRLQFAPKLQSKTQGKAFTDFEEKLCFQMQEFRHRFRYKNSSLGQFNLEILLKPAMDYSLVRRDKAKNLLMMHRLVQTVLREQLSQSEQRGMLEQVAELLVATCPNDETDFVAWSNQRAEWLLNARVIQQQLNQRQLQLAAMATLSNQMGYYLAITGDYAQALPLFQQALAIREQVLGKQHRDYALSLNNLGALYKEKGDYAEALRLVQQALAIGEKVLGKQHYATSLNNLAGLYKEKGDYAEALRLVQQALAIREQVSGKQHPDYAKSLNNLAMLHKAQGDYAEALSLHQEALTISEQVLGKQHPDYAQSLNNLAALYETQGDYAQAFPLFEQALSIYEQVLGKQHPYTKLTQKNYEICQQKAKHKTPFKRKDQKIGRNAPCFCGSGKKYKHCHGKIGNDSEP